MIQLADAPGGSPPALCDVSLSLLSGVHNIYLATGRPLIAKATIRVQTDQLNQYFRPFFVFNDMRVHMSYARWALALTIFLTQATLRAESIPTQRVVDLDGKTLTLPNTDSQATAIIFIGTQCPISNRYVPQLNEMFATDQAKKVDLIGVVVDQTISRKDVIAYRDQYKIAFPIVFDASGTLAKQFKPTKTPEVFLIDHDGEIRYHGRIDDSFAALGKINQVVKSHDLVDAISAVLENQPVAHAQTEVVGCPIEETDAKSQAAKVTYSRDIAPILDANCVACHREGQIAPFSLTSYIDATKHAKLISDVTGTGYMPPWKPAEGFGRFLGEHRLSGQEVNLLKSWADGGAPQGDAADLPALPKFASDWALGTPDIVVKMPEAFTVPAGGKDIYRAFVAPINVPDDCYVAGIEFRPGAPTVVHHCLLYLDSTGAARKLDEADPAPGYVSFGGPGFTPSGGLGGWKRGGDTGTVAGRNRTRFAKGFGRGFSDALSPRWPRACGSEQHRDLFSEEAGEANRGEFHAGDARCGHPGRRCELHEAHHGDAADGHDADGDYATHALDRARDEG